MFCEIPRVLQGFNETLGFSQTFHENPYCFHSVSVKTLRISQVVLNPYGFHKNPNISRGVHSFYKTLVFFMGFSQNHLELLPVFYKPHKFCKTSRGFAGILQNPYLIMLFSLAFCENLKSFMHLQNPLVATGFLAKLLVFTVLQKNTLEFSQAVQFSQAFYKTPRVIKVYVNP